MTINRLGRIATSSFSGVPIDDLMQTAAKQGWLAWRRRADGWYAAEWCPKRKAIALCGPCASPRSARSALAGPSPDGCAKLAQPRTPGGHRQLPRPPLRAPQHEGLRAPTGSEEANPTGRRWPRCGDDRPCRGAERAGSVGGSLNAPPSASRKRVEARLRPRPHQDPIAHCTSARWQSVRSEGLTQIPRGRA